MNASQRRPLLWLVIGIVLVLVVGIAAYNIGLNAAQNGTEGPFSGRFGPGMMVYGYGWFGFLGPLLFIVLIAGLLAWAFVPSGGQRGASSSSSEGPRSGVDQLKDLAELHDRGQLSDEEFAAAKRRLLGL